MMENKLYRVEVFARKYPLETKWQFLQNTFPEYHEDIVSAIQQIRGQYPDSWYEIKICTVEVIDKPDAWPNWEDFLEIDHICDGCGPSTWSKKVIFKNGKNKELWGMPEDFNEF
jgi:hypothetical protein